MSNEATQYVPGFMANLQLVPQQRETRLVHAVDADLSYTAPGTLFNADDIDDRTNETAVTGRAPPTPENFANHLRRVGFFASSAKGGGSKRSRRCACWSTRPTPSWPP
jgi:hypothetical protein